MNTSEEKTLLTFHSANAFQLSQSGKKSDWKIRENETNRILHTLPNKLNDPEVTGLMSFIRGVELEAFNIGITFQKKKQNEVLITQIADLKEVVELLKTENVRLSTILENLLPSEE